MSISYNASTNFGAKDALPSSDPDKVIYGADFTTEFTAITAAFALAAPTAAPTFTGTSTFAGNISGTTATFSGAVTFGATAVTEATVQGWNTVDGIVSAGAVNWDSAYDNTIVSAAFNTGDGVLTLTQQDAGTVTVDLDGRYSTTDTTYTGGTNITLAGTTFNLDSALTGLTDVTTDAVSIGLWEIKLDTNDLRFVYNGTDVFRITTAGALIAADDVTAFGTP